MGKEKVYKFTDPGKPAKSLVFMLKLSVIFSLAAIISGINELRILMSVKDQTFPDEATLARAAELSDTLEISIGVFQLVLGVIIIITFLRWQYRAAANTQSWGIVNISQKPHWGFWNFIIPVWSLFKPYIFLRELWNAFEYDPADPERWKTLPAPHCLKIWWTVFIADHFIDREIAKCVLKADKSIDEAIALNWLYRLSEISNIVGMLALLVLVSCIMKRQMEYAEKVAEIKPI